MRSLRFKVSTIKNYCRHQALYEWTIGKVQNGTSMYGSYHPTPHMKMFIAIHAGSTDKREEMTEKKDMKVPFPLDRSALSNSRPQNSAPQFVSMRLSLSPPSTSPHLKKNVHPMARCFYTNLLFFLEMSIFPYIANSMIL